MFLRFQAPNTEEGLSHVYQVIRRFILSKGFESSFGLRLLTDMLNQMLEERRISHVVFNDVVKKQEESSPEDSVLDAANPNPEECDDSARSDVSNSTVLYNTDTANCEEKPEIGKDDFLDSDTNSSSSESSKRRPAESKPTNRTEKTEKEENKTPKDTNAPKDTKAPKETNEEDQELEKLLRMTEITDASHSRTYTSPKKDEEEKQQQQQQQKDKKPKEPEVSLMDCLNCENEDNSPDPDPVTDDNDRETEFLTSINEQTKKTFLLSSDESPPSNEETDNEESVKKKTKRTKKEDRKQDNEVPRKQDDLSEFRLPNLSEEEEEEEEEEEQEEDEKEEDDSSFKEDEQEESDDSVQCVQFVKKRKKRGKEQSSDTDSDGEVQHIPKTESSPTKGRKNIKKILKKEYLQVETKQALKMENERKKRVKERQEMFEKLFPDTHKRLVLDFDPQTKEELVVVDETLSRQLKPHQKQGIRFMWNCCFESLSRLEEDSGSGCVLAHCMGLGKTLQVITLIHTVLTHNTGVHTALIICPLNTIRNWVNEFENWLSNCRVKIKPIDIIPCKTRRSRAREIQKWGKNGGVLIISYQMFRSLIKKDNHNLVFLRGLLDPGADLVVCDEGHVIKNSKSALSMCISRIKTLRRIILTGTPLQNNLTEYYCMVQFVKPNILGTMNEFRNRFVHPIENGQFEDSTQHDVRLMKRRAHVLHTMLEGFVQRFGYYVLTPFLPEKQEYVISISLTESQDKIYRMFIEQYNRERKPQGLLRDFHWFQKVWTHPRVMLVYSNKLKIDEQTRAVWKKYVKVEEYEDIESSGKLLFLFNVLKLSKENGDKVLVFSQSLFSLKLIEYFLKKLHTKHTLGEQTKFSDSWVYGEDYYRLDGSTSSENRDFYCQKFNDVNNTRFRLFLVSTKAGGLGINLVAANRVVVFDASWNPTHDAQSIFRVYRFGQKKPCFIYRLLAAATMEEKIYKRQVTKLSLAHRILDEHQIERHYTMGNLQELYTYDPPPKSPWISKVPKDKLFAEILSTRWDIIVGYHEHDSLLENKEEEELTEEERKAAWEDYEKEKLTPQFPPQLNGNAALLERLKRDGLSSIHRYRQVTPPTMGVQTETQMCKIVDVRTLQNEENSFDGAGRFIMNPYNNGVPRQYSLNVGNIGGQMTPWHTPVDVNIESVYTVNEI